MTAFFLLIVALAAGFGVARVVDLSERTHRLLDNWVICIALPAVVLADLHSAQIHWSLAWIVLVPWVTFAFAAAVYAGVCRAFKWSAGIFGALLIVTGVGNTSFIGLPMIQVFFGARWRATGIVIDQLGTYLILSTLGITIAALCGKGDRPTAAGIVRLVVTFPPFIAVCLAFALHPVHFPSALQSTLSGIGMTLAPVALFTVGTRLELSVVDHMRGPLAVGLVCKLLVFPVVASLVLALVIGDHSTTVRVTMFEMAMPPTIGGAIIANRYELAGVLPSLLVGFGILASFVTLPLWAFALHRL